jgi:capsular exopolysaccharide synthesis family protein
MGKFTEAIRKAAEKRIERVEKKEEAKPYVVRTISDSKIDPHVLAYFDPTSPIAEQYRILRSNIQSINKAAPPRVLAITSAIHGEGKTITSINLAITFARDLNKESVLLVDADLRKGRLAKALGLTPHNGLADILNEGAKTEDLLLNIGIENLHILPSGNRPANPAELLGSEKMRNFVSEVRKQYDYVFFDCPPIVPVADAGVIAHLCDGALMVLQAGRTQKGIILHAQDRLHTSKVKILGYCLSHIEYHIPEYIYRYL